MLSQKQSSLPYFNRAFSGCLVVQLSPFHLWFLRSWLIGLITIHGSVVPPILFTTFVTSGRITAVKSVLDRLSAFTSLGKSELGQFIKNISIIHPIFCKNNLFQKKKLKAPIRKVSRNPPQLFSGDHLGMPLRFEVVARCLKTAVIPSVAKGEALLDSVQSQKQWIWIIYLICNG